MNKNIRVSVESFAMGGPGNPSAQLRITHGNNSLSSAFLAVGDSIEVNIHDTDPASREGEPVFHSPQSPSEFNWVSMNELLLPLFDFAYQMRVEQKISQESFEKVNELFREFWS